MKTKILATLIAFVGLFFHFLHLHGQAPGLVSGNLNISSFPTSLGGGKFQVSGTFSDPTGLWFAADVDTGMVMWKGNDLFKIDSILSQSGSSLTFRVIDVYSVGFIATGNAQLLELSANLKIPGVAPTGDSNAALTTAPDHASLLNYIIRTLDAATQTGSAELEYQAAAVTPSVDDGCFVTASAAGVTYARTGGSGQNTEGIVTVPASQRLKSVTVHFSSGQAPGSTFFLNIDYTGTARPVNGSLNTLRPVYATVTSKPVSINDGAPATNFVHSGTPLQVGIADVNDNGTRVRLRVKITNYNQQVGSNASILTVLLP